MQNVQHAVPPAGSQIAQEQPRRLVQPLQGSHMAAGQIHDVDVITDAGTVVGGPVVSENMQLFQLPCRHLGNVGDQIIGDAVGILPDQSRRVCADGVEIAEQRDPQLRVRLAAVRQNLLDKEFGISVGIGGGKRRVLPDRDGGRIALYRSGGGKHEFFDAVRPHFLQQHQRAAQIVGIDLENKRISICHTRTRLRSEIAKDSTKTLSSNRELSLPDDVCNYLKRLKRQQAIDKMEMGQAYKNTEYVARFKDGHAMSPGYISAAFNKLLKKYSLPHIRFHDLRDTAATLMLANGVDLKTIQDYLGYSSYNVTVDRYIHLDFEEKAKAVERLSQVIQSPA